MARPCPFCGGDDLDNSSGRFVRCQSCGAQGPEAQSSEPGNALDQAARYWDDRQECAKYLKAMTALVESTGTPRYVAACDAIRDLVEEARRAE